MSSSSSPKRTASIYFIALNSPVRFILVVTRMLNEKKKLEKTESFQQISSVARQPACPVPVPADYANIHTKYPFENSKLNWRTLNVFAGVDPILIFNERTRWKPGIVLCWYIPVLDLKRNCCGFVLLCFGRRVFHNLIALTMRTHAVRGCC